jgi:hypothetical protein
MRDLELTVRPGLLVTNDEEPSVASPAETLHELRSVQRCFRMLNPIG